MVRVGRGLWNAYAKLDGGGEELNTSGLGNLLAARYTRQVDVAGLDETLLTGDSLQHLLREAITDVSFLWMQGRKDWMATVLTGNQRRPWTGWRSPHHPWP